MDEGFNYEYSHEEKCFVLNCVYNGLYYTKIHSLAAILNYHNICEFERFIKNYGMYINDQEHICCRITKNIELLQDKLNGKLILNKLKGD
jgi:hypothetical protein